MKEIFIVGVGGFLGSVLRYAVYVWSLGWNVHVPSGTLLVNLLGSLILGLLFGLFARHSSLNWELFLMTGFCGGFTTFSTFSLDLLKMVRENMLSQALIYGTISVFGGLLCCLLGFWLIHKIFA
ncbi:MAG: fluoride efflux transporter CrcB [Cyclobacteriaceae bacterium]|nr:fluoride efflux transporter CrcB [Cyclobacteriaceae bacterium SS2]